MTTLTLINGQPPITITVAAPVVIQAWPTAVAAGMATDPAFTGRYVQKLANQQLELSASSAIVLTTSFQNGRRFTIGARDFPSPSTQYRLCYLVYNGGTGALQVGDVIEVRMVDLSSVQIFIVPSTHATALGSTYIVRQAWTALPAAGASYEGFWQARNATGARGSVERVWLEVSG